MNGMKVHVDQDRCEGHGRCYATAPDVFEAGLRRWLKGEPVVHDTSHVRALAGLKLPAEAEEMGRAMAAELRRGHERVPGSVNESLTQR